MPTRELGKKTERRMRFSISLNGLSIGRLFHGILDSGVLEVVERQTFRFKDPFSVG